MTRPLGSLLAVIFLIVQMLSTLHMAEHGFAEHKHKGAVCDIYLHYEHNKDSLTPDAAFAADNAFVAAAISFHGAGLLLHQQSRPYPARAPPVFLLS